MTYYVLEIKLQSPLTSASGEGRIGLVDRDVVFDDLGLPVLPGRRLKGLWRDAYRDVADAWQQCGESPTSAEQIFGDSGRGPGDGDAYIHVANAELKAASPLKEWLVYLQHPEIRKLHADDVVNHYATVRTQTAVDRLTGAAKENTLRLTRTLKSDLVFWAPVRFVGAPNTELQNALALGAAALQHMGTTRTRGLGKVRCRLLKLHNGDCEDLTSVLSQSSLPSLNGAGIAQPVRRSAAQMSTATDSNPKTPTHILRYRLTLREAAVIPVSDGDPNTVVTRHDIPGSHLWGAAAWHYLNQLKHEPTDPALDPAFRHAFLDDSLRFLAAYPEVYDPEEFDEPLQRTIPIPHSIRELKEDGTLVDFTESLNQEEKKKPKKRINRRYAKILQGNLETLIVEIERNYHNARASNRRMGRALGAEVPDGGAFFRYEAIQAGQSFQGAVLGSDHNLKNLRAWLKEMDSIRLGRSRSAQYGEAKFEWIGDVQELTELVEWDGFIQAQEPPNLDNRLIITTLSPLLAVNDDGHPDTRFPKAELAEVLQISASELTLQFSYTRTEMVGGYHTHLRLPRQLFPAIAAGSVFEFKLPPRVNDEWLLQLEQNGLGLRKGEGYGRIAVNRQHNLNLTGRKENQLDRSDSVDVRHVPGSKMHQDLQDLLQGIAQKRCTEGMQEDARNIAEQLARKNLIPSNALLGRLRLLLRQNSPDESLEQLRDPAKNQLTNSQIDTREFKMSELPDRLTLFDLFKSAWTQPGLLTQKLIRDCVEELSENCDEDIHEAIETIETLVVDQSANLCTEFLDYLLTTLRRSSRT